jgi:serine protease Do
MADRKDTMRFICKTEMLGLTELTVDGRPVIEFYEEILNYSITKTGKQCEGFLAQPILSKSKNGSENTIAWYGEYKGEATPLTELQGDRRRAAEYRLAEIYKTVMPILTRDDFGPHLAKALYIVSLSDVMVTQDGIILTNWGLVPESIKEKNKLISDHFAATLGTIYGIDTPRIESADGNEDEATDTLGTTKEPNINGTVNRNKFSLRDKKVIWVGALGIVLGILVGWWLEEGQIIGHDRISGNENNGEILVSLQRKINNQLEKELSDLERSLNGNVCTEESPNGSPPSQVNRNGEQGGEADPSGRSRNNPRSRGDLAEHLKKSTVFIIAKQNEGAATGSGFFVAPGTIVTNAHIVEGAISDTVLVTSKMLGELHKAKIISVKKGEQEFGGSDFAILQLEIPRNIPPLMFAEKTKSLDRVISAGFPGLVINQDEELTALKSGDSSAVPEIVLTSGEVSVVQNIPNGLTVLAHTAEISPGNSGGPLVDVCGRIVGINTFVVFDKESVSQFDYAIASSEVIDFLRVKGVSVRVEDTPCDG